MACQHSSVKAMSRCPRRILPHDPDGEPARARAREPRRPERRALRSAPPWGITAPCEAHEARGIAVDDHRGDPAARVHLGPRPVTRTHRLDAGLVHYEWNNAIAPRLEIVPGDTVIFDTRDASDGYYAPASTHADVLGRGPFRGHPLTGPVRVRGAAPGGVLVIEMLDVKPAAAFGWTAIRPGRGLLPEADFPKPFLQIWDLSDGRHARMGRGIAVPIAPFPGGMGVALAG